MTFTQNKIDKLINHTAEIEESPISLSLIAMDITEQINKAHDEIINKINNIVDSNFKEETNTAHTIKYYVTEVFDLQKFYNANIQPARILDTLNDWINMFDSDKAFYIMCNLFMNKENEFSNKSAEGKYMDLVKLISANEIII